MLHLQNLLGDFVETSQKYLSPSLVVDVVKSFRSDFFLAELAALSHFSALAV
jgi:hypothetical protein